MDNTENNVQTTAQTETDVTTTTDGTVTPPEQTPAFSFQIKYNHNDEVITDENELRELAQIGKKAKAENLFDEFKNLKSKVETYETELPYESFATKAKAKNMTVAEYKNYLEDTTSQIEITNLAEELGVTYALAERLWKSENSSYQPTKIDEKKTEAKTENNELNETDLVDFISKFPTLTAKDLPEAVIEEYQNGTPLTKAYQNYLKDVENQTLKNEIETLKSKIDIKQTNDSNSEAAVGGATGGGETISGDIYTKEQLDALTPQQIDANLDKALKSMTYWSQKSKK